MMSSHADNSLNYFRVAETHLRTSLVFFSVLGIYTVVIYFTIDFLSLVIIFRYTGYCP